MLFDNINFGYTLPKLIDTSTDNYIGFKFIAMQSLLYGEPDYSIFDGEFERARILEHLESKFEQARKHEIKKVVFGSPRNRWISSAVLNDEKADVSKIANEFFIKLCFMAQKYQIDICLEANPKQYNCNFITTTFEAVDFINKLNLDNLYLNLDISTILLNRSDLQRVLDYSKPLIKHIHLSSPEIKDICSIDNNLISKELKKVDYNGYISLEMRSGISDNNIKNLERNIQVFNDYYS